MNIVVTGASGGIGQAFVRQLAERPGVARVDATWRRNRPDIEHPAVHWHALDLTDEAAIAAWSGQLGEIDWLINAAGMLHRDGRGPEKTIRHLDPEFFMENMQTNALPSLLLAKHLGGHFRHGRPAIFATVSAKVGSIGDNRLGGWVSYRASKAALNMCMKTLSIEWRRTLPNVSVAVLHPGTTDTALSKPFQRNVPPGQLFSADRSVGDMLGVLDRLGQEDSGGFWAYDGEQLPW
ncbi:MAG: SDR family NAD(P)-dependent oxidoreductase [Thiohalobacterales bacterium]|nr:SDR family NAD(P)-dependent oxidoreductase [Thiohalobacterales bacterium]